jgi:xylulokinase
MSKYLAGVDVGTTGARCCLFDLTGKKVGSAYFEYKADYPRPGWVEQHQDAMIAQTMEACAAAVATSGINPVDIASIGFSTQRSVTCPVDVAGHPVRPMISWQDARSGKQVAQMRELISDEEYYTLSGLPLGTTWLISKILWMRENEPANYERTAKFVQNQDLVLKAFGAEEFYTDVSDMAFYGVWDVRSCQWNKKLMELFKVNQEMFGRPVRPGTQVGTISAYVANRTGFVPGTPICVGAGDQNCSVVGMGAINPGMATVTLGTAGLAILVTDQPVPGFGGMMITNHVIPERWEVEGLSNAAASSLRWFRDEIATLEVERAKQTGGNAYELLNKLAATSTPGAGGILFMPYLATAGTPRWNHDARGAFIGLSLAHGRADMVRAVMEGVVLEIRDMMEQWLQKKMPVELIRIGGGATNSALWNQIQADIYGRPVQVVCEKESTALGAALLGGVGAGVYSSVEEGVASMVTVSGEIEPDAARHVRYEEIYQNYVMAYQALNNGGVFKAVADFQDALNK